MSSSFIRGKYVICNVTGRTEARVVEDGAIFQQDGTIVDVGPAGDLGARYRPDTVIGSDRHVVMPGLVNSHHHVGLTPFQLGSPDAPLEWWLARRLGARDVDPYLDTLYSAFEMVASGVTTVQHIHGRLVAPSSGWPAITERIFAAYHDIGMRVSYCSALRDQNWLVCEADEDFLRRLPSSLVPEVAAMLAARQLPAQEYMDFFVYLWERCDHNTAPRARVQLAPANLHWCSDDALMLQKEYARRYGVGLHMHLLETPYQKEYARRRTGTTAVRHLDNLGFLGPDVTLGHGAWLTEDDIDLVAASGAMICHNPSSNLRLRSGIAPLNPLSRYGVRVALGIDEAGVNDDRDMLQEMRLALNLHRVPGMDDGVPTAPQVLQMATEHGALTTGFGDTIGRIEPGKAADLVVMRWEHIAYPYLDRDVPIVDAVLQRGRPRGVETVIAAGEVLYHDGRFTKVDQDAALRELAASLAVPLRPDEMRRRELASSLVPYVKSVYDGWLDHNTLGEPFYTLNACR